MSLRNVLRFVPVFVLAVAFRSAAAPPDAGRSDGHRPAASQGADLDALAQAIPGFGGYFLQDGVPTVYLTDPGQRGAAEAALAGLATAQGIAPSQIRILRGNYEYGQLGRWFEAVSQDAFEIPGVVFVDLDEAANRVAVGVEHAAAEASVRGLAARLGVPADALAVEQTEPIQQVATLRDKADPRIAGVQIHFGQYLCTLGFNAIHEQTGSSSFITCSHCTNKQGGTEGTMYYQPLSSVDPVSIGTEVDDPEYFRGSPCPRGRRCRYSDSARAEYASGIAFDLGKIAQTSGPNNNSIAITGAFTIASEGNAAVGQTVNKMGRTTGWTQGLVSRTCVNTGVSGTNIVQICQTFVNAGVAAGDSGSPVFAGSSNVTLMGILWGGNYSGTQFVYSPLGQVEQELGGLAVH